MTPTFTDWEFNLAIAIFMIQIVSMAFRFSRAPGLPRERYKLLRFGSAFLMGSLILTAVGVILRGPVSLGSGVLGSTIAHFTMAVSGIILVSWVNALRGRRRRGGNGDDGGSDGAAGAPIPVAPLPSAGAPGEAVLTSSR